MIRAVYANTVLVRNAMQCNAYKQLDWIVIWLSEINVFQSPMIYNKNN